MTEESEMLIQALEKVIEMLRGGAWEANSLTWVPVTDESVTVNVLETMQKGIWPKGETVAHEVEFSLKKSSKGNK